MPNTDGNKYLFKRLGVKISQSTSGHLSPSRISTPRRNKNGIRTMIQHNKLTKDLTKMMQDEERVSRKRSRFLKNKLKRKQPSPKSSSSINEVCISLKSRMVIYL